VRAEADTEAKEHAIPVELTVQGDTSRVYRGTIYSFDNRISTASGTIRARARFSNKDGALVPGMFVSVKLGSSAKSAALLVPDRAIGSDQNKKFVYVVGNDGNVAYREVNLGSQVGGRRIVLSGLEGGERVVVDGLQHIVPGVKVEAREDVASLSADGHPER
jgi:membrane fusion protein, multidrug efflux system